jgi:hypothetical protein
MGEISGKTAPSYARADHPDNSRPVDARIKVTVGIFYILTLIKY